MTQRRIERYCWTRTMRTHQVTRATNCTTFLVALSLSVGVLNAEEAFIDPIYGVSTTLDIVYGTGDTLSGPIELKLDLYQPTDVGNGALPARSPGIVLVHGATLHKDHPNWISRSEDLAAYGYTVATINYRFLPVAIPETHGAADLLVCPPEPFGCVPIPEGVYAMNAAIEDATTAIAWMRTNANAYNVDASHIALGGASLGAHITHLQAFNSPPSGVAPQAVLSFLGAMYTAEDIIQIDAPPALVMASSDDPAVPFDPPFGTQAMVDRMNAAGVYNEFYVQTRGHHLDFSDDFDGKTLLEHMAEFLGRFLVPDLADYDGDGVLGGGDFLSWQRGESPEALTQADLVAWSRHFGSPLNAAGSLTATPEPAGAKLLIFSLATAVIRSRRHSGRVSRWP